MKAANFLFFISFVIIGLSCKKTKETKVCNTAYLAWDDVGFDSLILTELNSNGIKKGTSHYLAARLKNPLVYNKKDHCFYTVQADSNYAFCIYRFNIKEKKTDILYYSGPPFTQNGLTNWSLAYNSFVDKFYLQYFGNTFHLSDAAYEVTILDNTFTINEITALEPYHFDHAPLINEQNGDMYYVNSYRKYSPVTKNLTKLPGDVNSYINNNCTIFNQNDKKMYGILDFTYANSQYSLWSSDLEKNNYSFVCTLDYASYESYTTFDVCNEQYVIQAKDSIVCIKVKDGSVAKKIKTDKVYSSITYIPE